MKTVLIVAGSDPGAGAGLQQDLKTATLLGVYGLTVVTAVTVQNSQGVAAVHPLAPEVVAHQWDALATDFPVDAIKIGMLATAATVGVVAARLRALAAREDAGPPLPAPHPLPVVLDPVLAAGRGEALLDDEGVIILKNELFPLTLVLTPNVPEAARLTGMAITTPAHLEDAARRLAALGPAWVLAKGGHLPGEPVDVLTDGNNAYHLEGIRLPAPHHHGSGCLLATALAAGLAQGLTVPEAVRQARALVVSALRHGLPLGRGVGPVNPYAPFARRQARYEVLEALQTAAQRLVREDIAPLIPEVTANLAYAAPYAEGPDDVAAFPGGLLKTPQGVLIPLPPAFGAAPVLAALILTVQSVFPQIQAAMRLRSMADLDRMAPLLHLRYARLDAREDTSGVAAAPEAPPAPAAAALLARLEPWEQPPDLLRHGDGPGALLYVLGEDPGRVAAKALAMKNALETAGRC